MIGVVIRDFTYLKYLQPLCDQFIRMGVKYGLYYWDHPRGPKEYNRASLTNIRKAAPHIVKCAASTKAFTKDKHLLGHMKADGVTKMVSVEIFLWAKSYIDWFRQNKIKTFSLLSFVDSTFVADKSTLLSIDKSYHNTKYLMDKHYEYLGLKNKFPEFLGSPMFDCIDNSLNSNKNILVMLPNGVNEPKLFFGSEDRFIKIIESISKSGNIFVKARRKQWIPKGIFNYTDTIIYDDHQMYPSQIALLLKKCSVSVSFFSSSVYECVYGGNYVYNVNMPLQTWNRWKGSEREFDKYVSVLPGNVYNYSGVVETVSQDSIINNPFILKAVDPEQRQRWLEKFLGPQHTNSAELVAQDIVNFK